MEGLIAPLLAQAPLWALFLVMAVSLYTLAFGADMLVEEAVALAKKWGISPVVIGATIVSLGTTTPEAAVSVSAAVQGNPGLALGNAVGSIITDCGLILGLAACLSPLPLDRQVVNRQGWIQLGAGFALVLFCVPFASPLRAFSEGGLLPQWAGFIFVAGLVAYIYLSIAWSKNSGPSPEEAEALEHAEAAAKQSGLMLLVKLVAGIAIVIVSSQILIPSASEAAIRMSIPEAVIAATLVAFGTSLPELVTAITAVRKGHGELAVGNVVGADILNVLFVAGLSASVTPAGLQADPHFFRVLFPGMLLLLAIFRIGVWVSKTHLTRGFGVLMLLIYLAVMVLSYALTGHGVH